MSPVKEELRLLTPDQAREISGKFGTPVYAYAQSRLEEGAKEFLEFPNAFGLTVRYAMKANPNKAILRIFDRMGLHIDASSEHEVRRAMSYGISPQKIMLTAQQVPAESGMKQMSKRGVIFNACSLSQLERFGKACPGSEVSIRINPGLGSGGTNRTNVGGPASSFGIWHEHISIAKGIAEKFGLTISRIHTHIGSGSDPEVWKNVALMSMKYLYDFEEAHTLNLGGGYKIGRMSYEKSADLQAIGRPVKKAFMNFYEKTGRKIHLEVEPGTRLLANSGCVIATVKEVVDTGAEGYHFVKVDSGMTEVTRPSMYGAQHPLIILPSDKEPRGEKEYIVAGHCCESGDIWTPAEGDPEALSPRLLTEARKGDLLVIEGAGAYCAGMSTKNYNSFPEAAEVLLAKDGKPHLIRKRQSLEQMTQNEVLPDFLKQ